MFFGPRWTQGADYVPSTADQLAGHADVILSQVDAYKLKATVSSPIAEPLRFTSLYFPGWRCHLGLRYGIAYLSEHQHGFVDRGSASW